jgi:hypothetical protein
MPEEKGKNMVAILSATHTDLQTIFKAEWSGWDVLLGWLAANVTFPPRLVSYEGKVDYRR